MNSGTPPKQARRDDPRVVDDQELIASQKKWKIREQAVFENS
jgi:hypothetical protein